MAGTVSEGRLEAHHKRTDRHTLFCKSSNVLVGGVGCRVSITTTESLPLWWESSQRYLVAKWYGCVLENFFTKQTVD